MDNERNFAFLGSADLSKFTISENKKQIPSATTIEHRNFSQRSFLTQVDFILPFSSETLITVPWYHKQHIEVELKNAQNFDALFDGIEIEASSLNNRGHYTQFINPKLEKTNERLICTGSAITHTLKVGLLLKNEGRKKLGRSSKEVQEALQSIISENISDINIYGITVNSNPSPVLLTKLLNISLSFKKFKMNHEAAETDLLTALSLISARRFVQAAELLRKVSKFYVDKYGSSRTVMDFSRTERSWIRDTED